MEDALDSDGSELFFSGFEYLQSIQKTYSFICKKVFAEFDHLSEGISKGDVMGVVIAKVDVASINNIVSQRQGLGETGQAYVVGPDGLLRSDLYLYKEEYNVKNSHANDLTVQTDAILFSLEGSEGIIENLDPLDHSVLTFHTAVEFHNETWGLAVEIRKDEIYAPIKRMMTFSIIAALIAFGVIGVIVYFLLKSSLRPIFDSNDDLDKVSNEINTNSLSLKGNSDQVKDSIVNLKSNIDVTTNALSDINKMVEDNLSNVQSSTDQAENCMSVAQAGRHAVEEMTTAIDEISDQNNVFIQDVNEIVNHLQEMTDIINEVASKTGVINDIVFQTKLLSFNASVEAARAGEHGKGFAVVAEEVGHLATASGDASKEIATMLAASIERVETISSQTKSKIEKASDIFQNKVNNGKEKSSDCDTALSEILENVQNVSTSITEIYNASKDQATGIQKVSDLISEVQRISDHNNSLSDKNADIAEFMKGSSDNLVNVIDRLSALLNGKGKSSIASTEKVIDDLDKSIEDESSKSDPEFEDLAS